MNRQQVLISNGYLNIDQTAKARSLQGLIENPHLITVINNINYFGYMPSQKALEQLHALSVSALAEWWKLQEPAFKRITADDRKMDNFVVYQNFPKECLEMSQCEYWLKQILMYFGFDKEHFREARVERDPLFEKQTFKVLQPANDRTLHAIYGQLLNNKARWSDPQQEQVAFLIDELSVTTFNMQDAGFRENGVRLAKVMVDADKNVEIQDATDVIRLAALMSDADVGLREKVKFRNFKRSERRKLLSLLENSKNLEADIAERESLWKHFLRRLHPGDFNFPRIKSAHDKLYKGQLQSYAAQVEGMIKRKDPDVFKLLSSRPGEFVRRLHHLSTVYGLWATAAFNEVAGKLTTLQLLKLEGYLRTINQRKKLVYPPRGNWNKLQIVDNKKERFDEDAISAIQKKIHKVIKSRLETKFPAGFYVDERLSEVKLQTNDQDLANYGRGTVFQIPDNMKFIRTASYWENAGGTSWFDNGWNFFDKDWKSVGTVCWNVNRLGHAAIFSGDPVNSKEMKGRACQMIDLYPEKLREKGVRYAVWNVLCFSNIPFSQATGEVLATLQWGENPQKGKLYEPSRAQMVFPLTGENKTKYVASLDLEENKLIYMDANLRGNVSSAKNNESILQEQMPAFAEYLEALPSVADLFNHHKFNNKLAAIGSCGVVPVLYSDEDHSIQDGKAYVFKPEKKENEFEQIDLATFLGN